MALSGMLTCPMGRKVGSPRGAEVLVSGAHGFCLRLGAGRKGRPWQEERVTYSEIEGLPTPGQGGRAPLPALCDLAVGGGLDVV